MSIKVVHGIIGEARKDPAQTSQVNSQTNSQIVQASVVSGQVSQLVTNEAVSVSVRNARGTASPEKIKEFKEARDVADTVADRVKRDEDSAGGAHTGLSEASGRPHLA